MEELPKIYRDKIFNYIFRTRYVNVYDIRCFKCYGKFTCEYIRINAYITHIKCTNCSSIFKICPDCSKVKYLHYYRTRKITTGGVLGKTDKKEDIIQFCRLIGFSVEYDVSPSTLLRKNKFIFPLRPNMSHNDMEKIMSNEENRKEFMIYHFHHSYYPEKIDTSFNKFKNEMEDKLLLHYYGDQNLYHININQIKSFLEWIMYWKCDRCNKILSDANNNAHLFLKV